MDTEAKVGYRRIVYFLDFCLVFNNLKTLKQVQGDGFKIQGVVLMGGVKVKKR